MEKPFTGRAILTDTFNGIEIAIPVKKHWFAIIFLGAWLGGWCMGEFMVTGILIRGVAGDLWFVNLFLLFWLCGWTAGGFFTFKTFLWSLTGKEIITFEKGQVTIAQKGMLLSKPKTYDLNEVKKLRVQEEENITGSIWGKRNNFNAFNPSGGIIRFDYGLQTVKFASGIDEAEANFIVDKLKAEKLLTEKNF